MTFTSHSWLNAYHSRNKNIMISLAMILFLEIIGKKRYTQQGLNVDQAWRSRNQIIV